LLHFLLLGALIFSVHASLTRSRPGVAVIEVTPERIEALRAQRLALYGAAPSEAQTRAAIEDYLQEEILYREALALGLDRDDTIVRRRLAQKMHFLIEDTARAEAPPSDNELTRYREAHRARYVEPVRITFEQVYFSQERRGALAITDARNALRELNASNAAPGMTARSGDPSMLAEEYARRSESEISDLYGGGFAEAVLALAPGAWHGPIVSSYGVHLVRVTERQESVAQDWTQARAAVLVDYQRDRHDQLNREAFARLRQRYRVVVDSPAIAASEPAAAREMP
jgi:hypothetical protein